MNLFSTLIVLFISTSLFASETIITIEPTTLYAKNTTHKQADYKQLSSLKKIQSNYQDFLEQQIPSLSPISNQTDLELYKNIKKNNKALHNLYLLSCLPIKCCFSYSSIGGTTCCCLTCSTMVMILAWTHYSKKELIRRSASNDHIE